MHNQFTITIHDVHGVKQFNIHQIVKKFGLYLLGFLLFIFAMSAFSISYLNVSVNKIEEKKDEMELAYISLKRKNQKLQNIVVETENTLKIKRDELISVTDKLSDIEQLIGLSIEEGTTLAERVDLATVTSEVMSALMQHVPNGSPVEYRGITSKFGYRIHPTLQSKEFHRGSDMKAPMKTPIYATADAIVEWAAKHKRSGYGNLIILDHSFGFKTYFGHLNKIVVKSGQFIKRGDLIGYTGNSGMSNGPHLHYEVRFVQRALNPFWFVKWNIASYNSIFEKEKNVPWQSLITATTRLHQTTTIPLLSQKVLLSRAR
ncbi:MAG: peptidase M23 [Arcobacter sp.]|nr:MAG: peptidase M23 [Arcobacter sp.]